MVGPTPGGRRDLNAALVDVEACEQIDPLVCGVRDEQAADESGQRAPVRRRQAVSSAATSAPNRDAASGQCSAVVGEADQHRASVRGRRARATRPRRSARSTSPLTLDLSRPRSLPARSSSACGRAGRRAAASG